MRFLFVMVLSLTTSVYGWSGVLNNHIEEQCHVDRGEHHNEAMADHSGNQENQCAKESHESEKDCQPEHCSDHCNLCIASASPGFVHASMDGGIHSAALLKKLAAKDSEKLSSISLRPDTPPPKA